MRVAQPPCMSDVTFVGLEPSDSIREYAERKAAALAHEPELMSCRVVLEGNSHSRGGKRFRAKFELDVPRQKLVVGASGEAYEDVYAAIDASYDEAKRALHEHAARIREARRQA